MDATRILAIRHGETAWNTQTRIQGHTDIPLNDKGLWQARQTGEALADAGDIHAIYSSDLQRAWVTAQAIAQATGAPLRAEIGLRERNLGVYEGTTREEFTLTWPEAARAWKARTPEWTPEGGESLLQLQERVARVLASLCQAHAGEQIVLVAHGGVLDVLHRLATGQSLQAPRTWQIPNAAINRLLWTTESLSIVGWSDTQHLSVEGLDEIQG